MVSHHRVTDDSHGNAAPKTNCSSNLQLSHLLRQPILTLGHTATDFIYINLYKTAELQNLHAAVSLIDSEMFSTTAQFP